MFCSSCDLPVQPDAKFCTACGAATAAALTTVAPAPAGCMGFLARLFGANSAVRDEAPKDPDSFWNKLLGVGSSTPAPSPRATAANVAESLPYRLNNKFLTRAEGSFFRVLQQALPEGVLLCPKVNLQDLFWSPPHDYTARNRIDRKHVDFVLADAETLRPVCGIELDDRSHQRPDRQERDRFVENVFAAAGLPLVRVPVGAEYDPAELAAALRSAIAQRGATSEPASRSAEPGPAPSCPKCRTVMVVRTAKSGANAGQKFYGCPNYPRCHSIAAF